MEKYIFCVQHCIYLHIHYDPYCVRVLSAVTQRCRAHDIIVQHGTNFSSCKTQRAATLQSLLVASWKRAPPRSSANPSFSHWVHRFDVVLESCQTCWMFEYYISSSFLVKPVRRNTEGQNNRALHVSSRGKDLCVEEHKVCHYGAGANGCSVGKFAVCPWPWN